MGAAASLVCAPAIAGVATLKPFTELLAIEKPPHCGFIGRLRFQALESALQRGWDDKRDGKLFGGISEASAMNGVVYARKHGWLPRRGTGGAVR